MRAAMLVVLLAFGGAAHAADSKVKLALVPFSSASSDVDLDTLLAGVASDKRPEALSALDALPRKALTDAEFDELDKANIVLSSPGVSTSHLRDLAVKQIEVRNYLAAELLAKEMLKRNPKDRDALAIINTVKGRGRNAGVQPKMAVPAVARAATTPIITTSKSHSGKRGVPPVPGAKPLDPSASDFYDKQLLEPLLKRSDANIVSRQYLSPLIRNGQVTIRLSSEKTDADLAGAWGNYDLRSKVITYNIDMINADIDVLNGDRAKSGRRKVEPITLGVRLSSDQVEMLTHRYLPLAVHEAGGHATHNLEMIRRLGTSNAPVLFDTEVMAWRIEAAMVAIEMKNDPTYLDDSGPWAHGERDFLSTWKEAHQKEKPKLMVDYLRTMEPYAHWPYVSGEPTKAESWRRDCETLRGHCLVVFDAACIKSAEALLPLLDADQRRAIQDAIANLKSDPSREDIRAFIVLNLYRLAISGYRMDPKGIKTAQQYYGEEENRVRSLEDVADPRSIWEQLRSILL